MTTQEESRITLPVVKWMGEKIHKCNCKKSNQVCDKVLISKQITASSALICTSPLKNAVMQYNQILLICLHSET